MLSMVMDYIYGGCLGWLGCVGGNLFYRYAVPHLGRGWNLDD